jgi:hypothetical protein
MKLTDEDIRQILALVEAMEYSEVLIETGGLKLHIYKDAEGRVRARELEHAIDPAHRHHDPRR